MFPLWSFLHNLRSRNLQRNFAINWLFSSFSLLISWKRTYPYINEMMLRGDIFHCNKFQLGCMSSWGIRYDLISIWVNRLKLLLCIWYWTWVLFSLISSYWLSSCYTIWVFVIENLWCVKDCGLLFPNRYLCKIHNVNFKEKKNVKCY